MDWRIQNKVRGNRDYKGVQIVKSGCIESWLHRCTSEFNAVLSWCGDKRTAHRFFDSKLDLASEVLSSCCNIFVFLFGVKILNIILYMLRRGVYACVCRWAICIRPRGS